MDRETASVDAVKREAMDAEFGETPVVKQTTAGFCENMRIEITGVRFRVASVGASMMRLELLAQGVK